MIPTVFFVTLIIFMTIRLIPGSIVDVMQTGFMIGDRLLRPAMVTVARRGETAPFPESIDTKA